MENNIFNVPLVILFPMRTFLMWYIILPKGLWCVDISDLVTLPYVHDVLLPFFTPSGQTFIYWLIHLTILWNSLCFIVIISLYKHTVNCTSSFFFLFFCTPPALDIIISPKLLQQFLLDRKRRICQRFILANPKWDNYEKWDTKI